LFGRSNSRIKQAAAPNRQFKRRSVIPEYISDTERIATLFSPSAFVQARLQNQNTNLIVSISFTFPSSTAAFFRTA
jgi:hypothetical protein